MTDYQPPTNLALTVSFSRRQPRPGNTGPSFSRILTIPTASRGMASSAGYNRQSPPALKTSGDPVVDDCYMSEPQLSNPRKRQRTEQSSLQPNRTSQPQSKGQKLSHHSTDLKHVLELTQSLFQISTYSTISAAKRRTSSLQTLSRPAPLQSSQNLSAYFLVTTATVIVTSRPCSLPMLR
jgi:hypothetical protein